MLFILPYIEWGHRTNTIATSLYLTVYTAHRAMSAACRWADRTWRGDRLPYSDK